MTRRFTVNQPWGDERWVVGDMAHRGWAVRIFTEHIDGPDCQALAQAAADELEARLNPPPGWVQKSHWVDGPCATEVRCYSFGAGNEPLAARVAYLLNTYGLDGDA